MIDKLAERHKQVAILVGRAYTDKEIARELNIEIRTVQDYVRGARRTLGLRNRVELALLVHGVRLDAEKED